MEKLSSDHSCKQFAASCPLTEVTAEAFTFQQVPLMPYHYLEDGNLFVFLEHELVFFDNGYILKRIVRPEKSH